MISRSETMRPTIFLVAGLLAIGGGVVEAEQSSPTTVAARPTTVLFICPHAAAKSVLASAYFQRMANERGLSVRVQSAGTDPEPAIAPAVAAHLRNSGYDLPVSTPRKVRSEDLAFADVVISIGCDLSGLTAREGSLRQWDEVPALSENFTVADAAIRKRVTDLVDELARSKQQ
jgi:arsenate reductase (thioredoxin)